MLGWELSFPFLLVKLCFILMVDRFPAVGQEVKSTEDQLLPLAKSKTDLTYFDVLHKAPYLEGEVYKKAADDLLDTWNPNKFDDPKRKREAIARSALILEARDELWLKKSSGGKRKYEILLEGNKWNFNKATAKSKWFKWDWESAYKKLDTEASEISDDSETTSLCSSNPCGPFGKCTDITVLNKEKRDSGVKCTCANTHTGIFCETRRFFEGKCESSCDKKKGKCLFHQDLREHVSQERSIKNIVKSQVLNFVKSTAKYNTESSIKYCLCTEKGYYGPKCQTACDSRKKNEWGYYCLKNCTSLCVEGKCHESKGCEQCKDDRLTGSSCGIVKLDDGDDDEAIFEDDEDVAIILGEAPLLSDAVVEQMSAARLAELFQELQSRDQPDVAGKVKNWVLNSYKGIFPGKSKTRALVGVKLSFNTLSQARRRLLQGDLPAVKAEFTIQFEARLTRGRDMEKAVLKRLKKSSSEFVVEGYPELQIDRNSIKTFGIQHRAATSSSKNNSHGYGSPLIIGLVFTIAGLMMVLGYTILIIKKRNPKAPRSNYPPPRPPTVVRRRLFPHAASLENIQRSQIQPQQGIDVVRAQELYNEYVVNRASKLPEGTTTYSLGTPPSSTSVQDKTEYVVNTGSNRPGHEITTEYVVSTSNMAHPGQYHSILKRTGNEFVPILSPRVSVIKTIREPVQNKTSAKPPDDRDDGGGHRHKRHHKRRENRGEKTSDQGENVIMMEKRHKRHDQNKWEDVTIKTNQPKETSHGKENSHPKETSHARETFHRKETAHLKESSPPKETKSASHGKEAYHAKETFNTRETPHSKDTSHHKEHSKSHPKETSRSKETSYRKDASHHKDRSI